MLATLTAVRLAAQPRKVLADATDHTALALGLPFLGFLPVVFLYLALVAWTATFAAFVWTVSRRAGPFVRRA